MSDVSVEEPTAENLGGAGETHGPAEMCFDFYARMEGER